MDSAHLVVRLGEWRGRICDAVSTLPATIEGKQARSEDHPDSRWAAARWVARRPLFVLEFEHVRGQQRWIFAASDTFWGEV